MALTLRIWFGGGVFRSSFFEVVGLWSSWVGFAFERAAGAVGEFIVSGNRQGLLVFRTPARSVGRRCRRRPQENIERCPRFFEAHAARRLGDERRGLAAELRHQIVRHLRHQQLFVKHVHPACQNSFRVQHHFEVADVDLDVAAKAVQVREFLRRIGQARHQAQRQRIVDADFVQANFDRRIGRQFGMCFSFLRAGRQVSE